MPRTCAAPAVLVVLLAAAPAVAQRKPGPQRPAHVPALRLIPERAYTMRGRRIALVHQSVRFHGLVRDYVPGRTVLVRVTLGARRYLAVQRSIRPHGTGGQFVLAFRAHRLGRLRAFATVGPLRARSRPVDVIPRSASSGQRGLHVWFLQHRLRALRYLVGLSGFYDGATERAVMAYRKVSRLPRNNFASREVFERLAHMRGSFVPRYPRHGKHVEADISRQVLALIDGDGEVFRIVQTASGAPATPTVRGSFLVYMKTWGVNSLGMVHSVYFVGGYAIHGYPDVPPWPASHGCLRIPIPNAGFVHRWLNYGDRVDVYG
jgi:hypothetical protein